MNIDFVLEKKLWRYEVQGDQLRLFCHGHQQSQFSLAPLIEGESTSIRSWNEINPNHFQGNLDHGGLVHLEMREGHIAYWMETDIEQFGRLTYFPGTIIAGNSWYTFSCDDTDRIWDVDRQFEDSIASAYADMQSIDGADGQGMTDPGDNPQAWIWNVPPRACALQTKAGWLGLSIPGPVPVGVTRLTMDRRRFSISFEILRSTCPDWGMPVVYFLEALVDPYDTLDEHRTISDQLELTVTRSADHPAWWSNAYYEYWDDYQCYMRNVNQWPDISKTISRPLYLSWIRDLKKDTGINEINATLEQGCYKMYGDYHSLDTFGGVDGMREMVDMLRTEGTRCGHYIHPYLVNTKLPIYEQRPDIFCKPRDGNFRMSYGLEMADLDSSEFAPIDWTNPDGRKWMLDWVEFILSDNPGCLNCDFLRSNHWRSPDARVYDFHDPDWGIGDLMTMKVQKMIYQRAKQIKPDCLVSKIGFADCYMQPWADMNMLCEEWNSFTQNWYRRGRIATRLLRHVLILTDAHFVTMTKSYEYHMGMQAWNLPDTGSVNYAPHPYTHYRKLQDKARRRRRSGWRAYLNAPFNVTDICHVDWDGVATQQWRKRTTGPLAGFYAALALSPRCLVTYSEAEAVVAASESRIAHIPLPPAAKVTAVERQTHEGDQQPWQYKLSGNRDRQEVEIFIEDCGAESLNYRIYYQIIPNTTPNQ